MRKNKDWLKAYLKYTALSEAPEIFHFWTGVSTLAGALRRRVWIDQRYFEWTPNFYIIFVAPPGIATKSTTLDIGVSMLRELEGVHIGSDSGTWQALGKALSEAREAVPKEGGLDGSFEEMSCITCAPGELGTFLDFKDGKLIDTLTSLWDGKRGVWEHSTIGRGKTTIVNPWINLISGTTPVWLKNNAPENAIGGGFASRVIFVFGDRKRQLVAYPGQTGKRDELNALRETLIEDLRDVSSLLGEMRMTESALDFGEKWYEKHWSERDISLASSRYEGYLARKQTHIHKLAMILSVSKRNDLWITEEELSAAAQIMTAMEADMINVFESIGLAPTGKLLNEIFSFLRTYMSQGVQVTRKMLWRECMQIMSPQEFQEALDAAIQAGYIQLRARGTETFVELNAEELNARQKSTDPKAATR